MLNSSNCLFSKLSRYVANITGSDAYWYKAKEELKAIIQHAGPPTFFFTLSAADMHWPELHHASLSSDVTNNDDPSEVRRQIVRMKFRLGVKTLLIIRTLLIGFSLGA